MDERTDVSMLKSVFSRIPMRTKVETMANTPTIRISVRLTVFARVLAVVDDAHIARNNMIILTIEAEIECACLMRPNV
jgi:hypothetical protein